MYSKSYMVLSRLKYATALSLFITSLAACNLKDTATSSTSYSPSKSAQVQLTHGTDDTAGCLPSYVIKTANATYFLDKVGGGLSSMIDSDGVDWLGFNNKPGSGHKGEYRGFPNAVHKQDGNYFHPMNSGTDDSTSTININSPEHIRITFTSSNKKWQGQWDFYPYRLDFTMTKVSEGHHYWIQYEGVPNGNMDDSDFWMASADDKKHGINQPFLGDLPSPEWIAFGDVDSSRVLYLLHHQDDAHPDNYVSRPDMTVFAFGRSNKDKFLNTPQTFSIGFVESTDYLTVKTSVEAQLSD